MYPRSQERHRNREATVYLPALGGDGPRLDRTVTIYGSAQEFVETRILGCFLENDEFGLCDRHAVGFEQQIAEILVATAPSKEGFDVAVDGFHHSEAYLGAA